MCRKFFPFMDYIRFDRTTRDIGGIVDRTDVPRRDMDVYHEKMTLGGQLYSEIDEEQRRTRAVSNEVSLLCLPGVDTRIVNTWNVWQWYCHAFGFWMWRMIFRFQGVENILMIFFLTIRNRIVVDAIIVERKNWNRLWLFFNRMEECLVF